MTRRTFLGLAVGAAVASVAPATRPVIVAAPISAGRRYQVNCTRWVARHPAA